MLRHFLLVVLSTLAAAPAAAQGAGDSAFALHGGLAYTRLAGADFERVQTLAGQDLFAQVDTRESRADFAVFLSQRLWAGDAAGLYATLGTAVNAPGEVLYLGGSVGVSRALVTLGLGTERVARGVRPAADEVFRGGGDRTLFAGVERTREWGFLLAVSFAIMR